MQNENKIRFYVYKTEDSSGQAFVIKSSGSDHIIAKITIDIPERRIINKITEAMINCFKSIAVPAPKYCIEFLFNKEYSLSAEAIYHDTKDCGRYLHHIKRDEFKMPLSEKEIRMFFLVIDNIPIIAD